MGRGLCTVSCLGSRKEKVGNRWYKGNGFREDEEVKNNEGCIREGGKRNGKERWIRKGREGNSNEGRIREGGVRRALKARQTLTTGFYLKGFRSSFGPDRIHTKLYTDMHERMPSCPSVSLCLSVHRLTCTVSFPGTNVPYWNSVTPPGVTTERITGIIPRTCLHNDYL